MESAGKRTDAFIDVAGEAFTFSAEIVTDGSLAVPAVSVNVVATVPVAGLTLTALGSLLVTMIFGPFV